MTALRHVGFTYTGEESPTLVDLTIDLPRGTMTAVLGPVGAGTSTLCRLFGGLLDSRGLTSGEIEIDGTVGLLGDDPEAQLSGLTSHVGDEVQLACRLRGCDPQTARVRGRQSLARLGTEDLWHRRLDTLSGGQRQLVALARIMALGPDLLILDQPSQSLDPDMRRNLADALREHCAQGRSVLITGHQIDELILTCDRVRFLDSGTGVPDSADVDGPDSAVRALPDRLRLSAQTAGVWDTRVGAERPVGDAPTARNAPTARDAPIARDVPTARDAPARPAAHAAPAAPSAEPVQSAPLLAVRDLSVVRAGGVVLDRVDVDLRPGELVALTGANGSGKSTLLLALIGLLDRTAKVSATMGRLGEGTGFSEMPTHVRSAHLGWVGQDPGVQLSAATVRAELVHAAPLPRHRRRDRARVREQRRTAVETVLRETELSAVADEHPFDLDVPRRKDVVIASALVTGPDVLLLDEPTIGRDLGGMDRLTAIIDHHLRRGGAVLAVTHDRRWAEEAAHRRLHLSGGRLSRA